MVSMGRYVGTGRAKCGCCGKVIPKGEVGYEVWAYHDNTKYCFKCVIKIVKKDLLDVTMALTE